MSLLLFHRFQFCAILYEVPHSVAKQAWPKLSGGGGGSVKTTASADRGACSGAFHCTRMDIHTEERTRASGLAGTDWTQRTTIYVFCFAGPPPSLGSFSFMHFERALVIMSDALPPRTVSARDIMFILPWFLVACRANSSNVSASSCPRDLAFAANSSKARSRRASLGLFWDAIKCTFSLRSGMSSSFASSFYVLCPLFHSSPYRLPLHPCCPQLVVALLVHRFHWLRIV